MLNPVSTPVKPSLQQILFDEVTLLSNFQKANNVAKQAYRLTYLVKLQTLTGLTNLRNLPKVNVQEALKRIRILDQYASLADREAYRLKTLPNALSLEESVHRTQWLDFQLMLRHRFNMLYHVYRVYIQRLLAPNGVLESSPDCS